jgi:hypothetical protein
MYPGSTKLEHSKIYRAGSTARVLRSENDAEASLLINSAQRTLDFRFHLKAAGGGRTEVLFRIEPDDFSLLVRGMDRLRRLQLAAYRGQVTYLRGRIAELEKEAEEKAKT